MEKDIIKNKLRESLFDRIREAGQNTEEPSARKDKDSTKSDAKNKDEENDFGFRY